MANVSVPESILVADCGSVATKVGLVDRVGDEYRLVGVARTPTTLTAPTPDISLGVRRAVAQLEIMLGRRLLTPSGDLLQPEQAGGEGSDGFVACTSAAPPLRGALIGLSRDFSLASARRALAGAHLVLESSIAVDEESGRWGTTARDGRAGGPSAAVENLAAPRPDLVIMVGGVDGGPMTPLFEMANIIAGIGGALEEGARPLVLFAGNCDARAGVAERIGPLMEFRALDNVRPTLERENPTALRNELESIYYEHRVQTLPGLSRLTDWAGGPIAQTEACFERVCQFLARRYDLRVLALDLGAATTVLIRADSGTAEKSLLPDIGLGYGIDPLLKRVGPEAVWRWLPPSVDSEQAHAQLLNQWLRPWTRPLRPEDRIPIYAAAREAAGLAASAWADGDRTEIDLVLLTGAPIAQGLNHHALVLLALDTLSPRGMFTIAADTTGLAPAAGALAAVNPEAAARVVENDTLLTLGTALVPTLPGRRADGPALSVSAETKGGGRYDLQVTAGSLELVPLGLNEKAHLRLRPGRGVDLGLPLRHGALDREVEGGTVGFVIDARGRPLVPLASLEQQRERVQQWLWEVGA